MMLYRIVKSLERTSDISGTGAFRIGGRWNSKGTYMLYTSENSSLAYLENLVHFDIDEIPAKLYLMHLQLQDNAPIYTLKDNEYPDQWAQVGDIESQIIGDTLMNEKQFLGIKVRSVVNINDHNYLLNPLFPGYHDLLKVEGVSEIKVDDRFVVGF